MNVPALLKNKFLIKILLAAVSLAILFSVRNYESVIDKNIESIYSLIRGQQQPDTNIVIINISGNDIDNLGHWPLKRSYYALLINSLTGYDVKAIGLEVFLSAKFVTQTLYDNLVTREIENSGKVVLSSVAGNLYLKEGKYYTDSLSYPSPKLLDEKLATGHLNYISGDGIQIPFYIHNDHVKIEAFSLQLAGKEFSFEDGALMKVNFISSWKKFRSYSILKYFQLVNSKSDELKNLKGKIVLIGVSDPQIATTTATTFDNNLPGVALHAFALDNILMHRWLNDGYVIFSQIFFIMLIAFLIFLQKKKPGLNLTYFYAVTFSSFIILTFVIFSFLNIELGYSMFLAPLLLMIITDSIFFLLDRKLLLQGVMDESNLLKKLLSNKEQELVKLQKELNISGESSSYLVIEKIKSLKADIEKLKESESDKKEAAEKPAASVANFEGIIYCSKAMSKVVEIIKKAAPEDANVLILGESGTGKELAANAIHSLSMRNKNNFVAVNCGALSDTLLESELFGHVKGAFTGAVTDKVGRFEAADHGTIFLDEIAETSENFQVKLLRVIQTGDFEKVGSSRPFHTDVRIIAATNRNIEAAVKERKFREDLYYRLNVIKIELPPLRERKEDIEYLTRRFLQGESKIIKLSEAAAEALMKNEWKGNVRELEAVIKRAVIFAKSSGRNLIQLADLPDEIIKDSKFSFEDIVIESLRSKKFSRSSINETAKELGNVSRTIISENFRGYALKIYVENGYSIEAASEIIAGSKDEEAIEKVKGKLQLFLRNIETDLKEISLKNFEAIKDSFSSKYKNLPHKFHYYLDEIIKRHI